MPFALTSSRNSLRRTTTATERTLALFFPVAELPEVLAELTSDVGCSDKSWNMICLSAQLNVWWNKALFKLRVHDSKEDLDSEDHIIVTLMFQWTSKRKGDKLELDELFDWDKGMSALDSKPREDINVQNMTTSRSIQTGDLFDVNMPKEDAKHFEHMITIQWNAISILEMAGGAGNPDLLLHYESDSDSDLEEPLQPLDADVGEASGFRASARPFVMDPQPVTLPHRGGRQSTLFGLGEISTNTSLERRLLGSSHPQTRDAKGKGKEAGSPTKTPTTPTQSEQPAGSENDPPAPGIIPPAFR